jgi:hypothetical protein
MLFVFGQQLSLRWRKVIPKHGRGIEHKFKKKDILDPIFYAIDNQTL